MEKPDNKYKGIKNILNKLNKNNEELLKTIEEEKNEVQQNNDEEDEETSEIKKDRGLKTKDLDQNTRNNIKKETEIQKTEREEKEKDLHIVEKLILKRYPITEQDRIGMEKAIDCLKKNDMYTLENLKKLSKIIYRPDSVEIGFIRRSRNQREHKIGNSLSHKEKNTTYFALKHNPEDSIKRINEALKENNMKIPSKEDYERSLEMLPGNYIYDNSQPSCAVLGHILNMSISGQFSGNHNRIKNKDFGYGLTSSIDEKGNICCYSFDKDGGGTITTSDSETYTPLYPILLYG